MAALLAIHIGKSLLNHCIRAGQSDHKMLQVHPGAEPKAAEDDFLAVYCKILTCYLNKMMRRSSHVITPRFIS
ncbi:hypothetical protein D3C78_1337510 [compost metagenome]